MNRFYRRNGRYLIRRPPALRPDYNHVTYSQARNLWLHVARLREAKGDLEGAARARQSALSCVSLRECVPIVTRRCPLCGKEFCLQSSSQVYCSRRCREIDNSPTHWLLTTRVACGNAAQWAPTSVNPDDVTCGNCKRHHCFELASFAAAWKADRLHAS